VGASAIGAVESAGATPHRMAATIGFVALVAVPVLLVAGVLVRALVHAWQPGVLLERLRDPDGAAPRLAGWVAVVWLATFGLASAMFQGTWLLAAWTAFKPLSVSLLAPVIGVATMFVIVALSRPAARLFAHLARVVDARWRRIARPPLPPTLLHPRSIVAGALVLAIVAGWLLWSLVVARRIGDTSLGFLWAVAAGIAAALAGHGLARWRAATLLVAVAVAGAIAVAGHAAASRPAFVLAMWADQPITARAIAATCDLEQVRREMPVAAFALPETSPRHPDLVLVTFEAMRADRTPLHGGAAAMPGLAELGRRGAVFGSMFAATTTPSRALPSLVTGLEAPRVRGSHDGAVVRLDPRHVTLAEHLRAGGYATAAFACCADSWGQSGWDRGIEHLATVRGGLAEGHALAAAARNSSPRSRTGRPSARRSSR
jgi:hypothetical protein